jgi:hypothetical protein
MKHRKRNAAKAYLRNFFIGEIKIKGNKLIDNDFFVYLQPKTKLNKRTDERR